MQSFSESFRAEAAPIWRAIATHPFLAELRAGSLPVDSFRYYISQDYHYLEAFGRAVALAIGKAPDDATLRQLSLRLLTAVERPLHGRLFELTGLDQAGVESTVIAPTNRAYIDHMLATAALRGLGETAAALLPCPWTYHEIGGLLAGAGELSDPIYRTWAGFYIAGLLAESTRAWRELLDAAAAEAGPAERERMRATFLLSSRYELRFWQMAYTREQW